MDENGYLTLQEMKEKLKEEGCSRKETRELLQHLGYYNKKDSNIATWFKYLGCNFLFVLIVTIWSNIYFDTNLFTRPIFVILMVLGAGWFVGVILSFPFQPWRSFKVNLIVSFALLTCSYSCGRITHPNYQPYNPIIEANIDCQEAQWLITVKYNKTYFKTTQIEESKDIIYTGTYKKLKEYENKLINDLVKNDPNKLPVEIISVEIHLMRLPKEYCKQYNYDTSLSGQL
jgi:hypothetical protein